MKNHASKELAHGNFRYSLICVCPNYVALNCNRCNMTRSELQYQIWHDLGYLEGKTPKDYQQHLWRLSDGELFNLWLNIHNAREAYKND